MWGLVSPPPYFKYGTGTRIAGLAAADGRPRCLLCLIRVCDLQDETKKKKRYILLVCSDVYSLYS